MPVLKVKYGEDTRRLTLERTPTYSELFGLLQKLFNLNNFAIKYEDDDGDKVTITSDMELNEAVNVANKSQASILRLFVIESKTGPSATTEPVNESKQEIPRTQTSSSDNATSQTPPFMPPWGILGQLLSNPNIAVMIPSLLQAFSQTGQQNPNANGIPDMEAINQMFKNLGLNQQNSQTSNGNEQVNMQQAQVLLHQLLQSPMVKDFLPTLISSFTQYTQNSQWEPSQKEEQPQTQDELPQVHEGVMCDGCGEGIVGIRYKCATCPDYDLCQECEKKGNIHNPSHVFLKISKPQNAGRGCPYVRPGNPNTRFQHRWGNKGNSNANSAPRQNYLARFVSDISIPDGTALSSNQDFVKIWRLRNEGTEAWPIGTRLEFVGGDKLSTQDHVAVPVVSPNEEIEIAVTMTTPSKPGRYVSYWRLSQSDGNRFGQRVWVDFFVAADTPNGNSQAVVDTQKNENPLAPAPAMEVEITNSPIPMESTPIIDPTPVLSPTPSAPPMDVSPVVEIMKPTSAPVSPKVQQLLDMGFPDAVLVEAILTKNNGDMIRAVQDLLNFTK